MVENGKNEATESSQGRRFVRQLMANQGRIYGYILTLVSNWADADDILQETAEVMWCQFEKSGPITNFTAWGIRIAHNKILNYYTKKGRQHVLLTEEILEDVAARAEPISAKNDDYAQALRDCLAKLKVTDLQLIKVRYEQGNTIKEVAEQVGRPVHGLYKAMARIHDVLLLCIRRTLAKEDTA